MNNAVVHWEIGCKDYKKGMEFYSRVFGWKYNEPEGMPYALVGGSGEGTIGGGIGAPPEGMPAYVMFYVQVDDLQATLDKAEAAGGKTIAPPDDIPGIGTFAWFADPEGNKIGLYKPAQ